MKLNKDICKKCHRECWADWCMMHRIADWSKSVDNVFEENWERDVVDCRVDQYVAHMIYDGIPEYCPYKLEHTVL